MSRVQFTGKSIFLMKKLQMLLRKTAGVTVSLQDPLVYEKLLAAGAQTDDEQVLALVIALRRAQVARRVTRSDEAVAAAKPSGALNAVVDANVVCAQSDETLDARVCALLANYCGPISSFLFKQSWKQLGCHDIYRDFDRLIDRLSSEIPDQGERVEFVEKCQQLVL